MKVPFLDLLKTTADIQPQMDAAMLEAAHSGTYIFGAALTQFEAEFSAYSQASSCIGVANGLDALRLGLSGMGVGPGDEVIVPANTYIATWLAVSQCGATPVPVEPDVKTYNMDARCVADAITAKTKAILAVHLYGQPADMDALRQVAQAHDIPILEDAAQAHGARYKAQRIGSSGTATFSFYPTKNLGALGDGGALTTDDPKIAAHVALMRNYGSEVKYVNEIKGVNSRLDSLQAAILSVKLTQLDQWNAQRRSVAARYTQAFEKAGLLTPYVPNWAEPVWHLYVLRHPQRDAFQKRLHQAGIATVIHYPIPPHLQRAYTELGYGKGQFPISERLADEIISLPMCPSQTTEQTDYVIDRALSLA